MTAVALLRDKAEQVVELVRAPGLAERRWTWYQELEDAVLDLSNALPEGTEDYDARKMFEFLVGVRRAITADPSGTDEAGEIELQTLKLRDVVRRIGRRLEHNELDDPNVAARSVFTMLKGAGVGDLSRLLGVSTKTVNTWKAGGPVTRKTSRVVVLAQVLTYLRASMTPAGLVMWFDAPRAQLGERTPLQVLDADGAAAARELLVPLARGARGQLAG
jgi:hypothetical protein